MPKSPKIQRWIDLISALLSRHYPVTFTELARDVPAYLADGSVARGQPSTAVKRMFERDKLDLRELGIPIETTGDDGSEESAYRLRPGDFYLPYIAVVSPRGTTQPRKIGKYGYRSLGQLALDADALLAVAEAASRVRQLGNPVLAADAESAMRKLAFDLPVGAASAPDDTYLVPPRARAGAAALQALGDALFRHKRVTFTYRSMSANTTTEREVEPYGLFFLNGHWYLAARDCEKDHVLNFRVSRIDGVRVNDRRPGTADYQIPASFDLREHARSRHPWELGDGAPVEATVRFAGDSGAVAAASALGRPLPDADDDRRAFSVRRLDAFARWLLSFAGDAVPVAPAELVEEFRRQASGTRALYARGGAA